MNDNIELAINRPQVEETAIEIINISDSVSLIFDKIDEQIASLDNHFKCNGMIDLTQTYNQIKNNYAIIKANIISYSEDLISLNRKMDEGEKYLVSKFNEKEEDFSKKKEEVNKNGN